MIRNDDREGNYFVSVFAKSNAVHGFQCPTLDDVYDEVNRIASQRRDKGLPTTKATARRLAVRPRGAKPRNWTFNESFEVMITV